MLANNILIHNSYDDFSEGTFESTEFNHKEGSIKLSKSNNKYANMGSYISPIIHTLNFKNLIISWNALTPSKTHIELYCRIFVNNSWSKWLCFGLWSSSGNRFSSKKHISDHIAYINTDTLLVKGSKNRGTAFQYKLKLITKDFIYSPSINLISTTLKIIDRDVLEKLESPNHGEFNDEINKFQGILDVPKYSQMTKSPKIAPIMCSAVCSSMLLNYHGVIITPEEVANGVYDSVYKGFGNWTFNTAFISTFGLESYIRYFNSIEDIKRELYNRNPVIVSVRYKQPQSDKDLPIISNAPIPYTNGHMIIITGFIHENGNDYILVNDPASKTDDMVSLKYLLSEFINAWSNKVAYVVHKPKNYILQPIRINGNLVKTGKEKIIDYLVYSEYQLISNEIKVDISKNNTYTIMYKYPEEHIFNKYCIPQESSTCWIPNNHLAISTLDCMFICKNGYTYVAKLEKA